MGSRARIHVVSTMTDTRLHRVEEIRDPQGGRNILRRGDPVKVDPGRSESRRWRAKFVHADLDTNDEIIQITVYGGKGYNPALPTRKQPNAIGQYRTVTPDRVHRLSVATTERKNV